MAEGFIQFPELEKLRDEGLSRGQLYTRLLEIRKVSEWLVVYVYVHVRVSVHVHVYLSMSMSESTSMSMPICMSMSMSMSIFIK